MVKAIDEKLDQFYEPTSLRYRYYSIWKEVFAIAREYELSDERLYNYEIKRLRDLKNTYDYALESANREWSNKAFDEGKMEVAKNMKQKGLASKDISELTGISENEIDKL